MAVAIAQLNLPEVIQRLVHSYVFFSKKNARQEARRAEERGEAREGRVREGRVREG